MRLVEIDDIPKPKRSPAKAALEEFMASPMTMCKVDIQKSYKDYERARTALFHAASYYGYDDKVAIVKRGTDIYLKKVRMGVEDK